MVAVPAATPVTTPVAETVAMVVALLVQLPPVVVSLKVMVLPTQTAPGPVILVNGVFLNTEMEPLLLLLAIAISGLPSPSISPMAIP